MENTLLEHESEFKPGHESTPVIDYTNLRVPKKVGGWRLDTHDTTHVRWRTPGNYWVEIRGMHADVFGVTPVTDRSHIVNLTDAGIVPGTDTDAPSEVRDALVSWLREQSIDRDAKLAAYPGIGRRTSETLQIQFSVYTPEDLYHFIKSRPDDAQAVLGDSQEQVHEQLRVEICFGT